MDQIGGLRRQHKGLPAHRPRLHGADDRRHAGRLRREQWPQIDELDDYIFPVLITIYRQPLLTVRQVEARCGAPSGGRAQIASPWLSRTC